MRICHVITRLIVGGAQENTLLSCEGLAKRGHDVTLVAGVETGPEGSLWEEAEASGARLVRLESLRRNPSPLGDVRCAVELKRIFHEGEFDVIHTHSSKAGILGRWAARRARCRAIVHTIHGMSFNRTQGVLTRLLYRSMERFAARRTDAFVTVADAMTEQAMAAGLADRDKFTTVYSGMRTDRYRPNPAARAVVRKRWGVPRDAVVVGTVARLFRNKGYEELMETMMPAIANAPSLWFVWVGDGPDRDAYVARLEKMGLRGRLHLTGLVSPDDIPNLIGAFDLLVHASRWEGLPRALVQGLLMGVPGIAFDIDGSPEVIEDGVTGRLVPQGDTLALTRAIVELSRSAPQRRKMGSAGRKRCLERFGVDRMIDGLERVYTRLLV